MDLQTINELMAVLGFIIPSAVLWQVWNIRATFNRTREDVLTIKAELAALKRRVEDEALKREVSK